MRLRFALVVAFFACAACSRKVGEPDPVKANPPSTGSATATAPSASGGGAPTTTTPSPSASGPDEHAPFGPKEYKEYQIKLSNEDCEKAAEKKNKLDGLPEHDKKGTLLIWACLRTGNLAWYRCALTADTSEHFEWCSRRYLISPDEVKLK